MTLSVWRVDKAKRASTVKTGEGARIVGGRWNSPGLPVIYCSEHLSLAVLEVIVHAPDPDQRRAERVRFRISFDDSAVETILPNLLPADFGPRTDVFKTRALGDEWLRNRRSPVLQVPSVIVPTEWNFLLNPLHPEFPPITWAAPEKIDLDERLWNLGKA